MHRIASACDEMIDRHGRVRAPWSPIMSAVREIGPEELDRRAAALNRQMGLAAPLGTVQKRFYDPLPVLLTSSEFALLEAGIKQRATLLNAVLEDLYGPQCLDRKSVV